MTVVVGSIQHETNTFSPVKPRIEDFDYAAGEAMLGKIAVAESFASQGIDVVPTIYANALPSGKLDEGGFHTLLQRLLDAIPSRAKPDGVWLHLHGAMEVEGVGSGEVAILEAVRRRVGPAVPVAVALDFHANNREEIAALANIVVGYRTAPHTDIEETQLRVAQLLARTLREGLAPRPVLLRVPLLLTGDMVLTEEEPMRSIIAEAIRSERESGVLCASVFNGQPWVDAPNAGASVLLVAPTPDTRSALAQARRIGRLYWDARRRFAFSAEALAPLEAVRAALRASESPVFVSDSGDNTTAGAAGDDTLLVRMLLAEGARDTVVAAVTDPFVVSEWWDKSPGSAVSCTLGGSLDPARSVGTEVNGTILCKGRVLGWYGEDAGRSVTLRLRGVDVVVTERRCGFISPEIFRSAGIELSGYRIVVVKLGYLFPRLAEVSRRAIFALTPGASCEAVAELPFTRVRRPLFPLDPDCSWDPA